MPDDLLSAQYAMMIAIIAVAGVVQGTVGLGFPFIATPLLALTMDMRSAVLVTLVPTVAVNLGSILRGGNWGDSVGTFWPLALYALVGSALGTLALSILDPEPFKLLLAALVFVYLGATRIGSFELGWVQRHPSVAMLAFGLAAGVCSGATNVMVPILIIYTLELGLARTAMVQTFNLCFLAGKLAQIAVFAAVGLFGVAIAVETLPLAGVALAAQYAGARLGERVSSDTYRVIVERILLLLALILVVQYAVDAFWVGDQA